MSEEWRPVVGWERLYEVSDAGQVRSVPRGGKGGTRGRTLRQPSSGGGYRQVTLSNGKRVTGHVHRLVAEAFLGPAPSSSYEVRHLDGDPSNNTRTNLAWGTGAENWEDRRRHGRGAFALVRGACRHGHPWTEENTYLGRNGTPTCRTCRRDGMRRKYHA